MRRRRLCPRQLSSLIQTNPKRLTVLLGLALFVLCLALNSAKFDTELANWIQKTERIERELQTIESAVGLSSGSSSLLVLQAAKQTTTNKEGRQLQLSPILSVNSLMVHLEALAIATHVTVDLYDYTWSLRDICFSPTPPDYEGALPFQIFDKLMPCAITTPLDCFWEGAKLLNPEQDVRFDSLSPPLRWTDLNPKLMVEARRRDHPHASFPYDNLLDWMRRVGITSGYVEKPCLDPTDPNCPISAPNKLSGELPDVGHRLTGGCYGLAANQMHWLEDEILGGIKYNRSGSIVDAEALQSSIQLLDEQDVFYRYRGDLRAREINNWSVEKAKAVLDSWQARFQEELNQFSRSSIVSSAYNIYTMTPKSMLEPINVDSVKNKTILIIATCVMVCFTLIAFPKFERLEKQQEQPQSTESSNTTESLQASISRRRTWLLASLTSLVTIITFAASLGLSSFINLPFNLATTQLLPPIALYYGFKQSLLVANIYAQQFKSSHRPLADLTTDCMDELLPVVLIESVVSIVCLTVASVFQVPATRVFVCQALTYFTLATFTTVSLLPSLMTSFLLNEIPFCDNIDEEDDDNSSSSNYHHHKREKTNAGSSLSIEEQILSRIQDDLKHIKADQTTTRQQAPDILATSGLPDLVLWPNYDIEASVNTANNYDQPRADSYDLDGYKKNIDEVKALDIYGDSNNVVKSDQTKTSDLKHPRQRLANFLVKNIYLHAILLLTRLGIFIFILSWATKVKFGLQVKDIIAQDTLEYESFHMQDKYNPIFNVFAITKGNFDYPNNQRLLYEYFKRIDQVDGIVRDKDSSSSSRPVFWLTYFRDWLIELQDTFDMGRNNSLMSNGQRTEDASDNFRLAYKLLAQTGKPDNPVDQEQVGSNRLVDKNGIINQRAFYYYLHAWVMNDAYSYSNSKANFKPEPRTWNADLNNLKMERPRPITYSQIPFLMKLPADQDSLRTIVELRTISQAFEQLNLPNFFTGIPFIFWDQFINLDLLFFATVAITGISLYFIISLMTSNFTLSAIILSPMVTTLLEVYGLMGMFSIEFNNVYAVMVISTIGSTVVQTIYFTNSLANEDAGGDLVQRWRHSLGKGSRTVITTLLLFYICGLVFRLSKIDFMIKYSNIMLFMATINAFNSLTVTPIILKIFGSMLILDLNYESSLEPTPIKEKPHHVNSPRPRQDKNRISKKHTGHKKQSKKRFYPRVQSEISLSTISEEP